MWTGWANCRAGPVSHGPDETHIVPLASEVRKQIWLRHSSLFKAWTNCCHGKPHFTIFHFVSWVQHNQVLTEVTVQSEISCTLTPLHLCVVIIYSTAWPTHLAPQKESLCISSRISRQLTDCKLEPAMQVADIDSPDKPIHLGVGTDKLRCRKTLCEAWYVIFKALQYDRWTAELCHLAVQHTYLSKRVSRQRLFHFVIELCDTSSQSCLSLKTNCPVYFLLLLWWWQVYFCVCNRLIFINWFQLWSQAPPIYPNFVCVWFSCFFCFARIANRFLVLLWRILKRFIPGSITIQENYTQIQLHVNIYST